MPSTIVTTEPGINSHVTRSEANAYLDDTARASSWEFVDDEDKDRHLLTAFRIIQRTRFSGTKTNGASQEAQFPRIGLFDINGDPVDSATVPQAVKDAQIELSFALSEDEEVETQTTTGSNVKRVKGGSAEVEFFVGNQDGTRLPSAVHELLLPFLSSLGLTAPTASGTDQVSSFCEQPELHRGLP